MRLGLVCSWRIGVQLLTNEKIVEAIRRKTDIEEIRETTQKTITAGTTSTTQHLDLIRRTSMEDLESFKKSHDEQKCILSSWVKKLLKAWCWLLYGRTDPDLWPPFYMPRRLMRYKNKMAFLWGRAGIKRYQKKMTEVHYNSQSVYRTLKELEKGIWYSYEMFSLSGRLLQQKSFVWISHSRIARYEIPLKIIQRDWKMEKCETQESGKWWSRKNWNNTVTQVNDRICIRENVGSRPPARDLLTPRTFVCEFFQREEKTPEHLSAKKAADSRQWQNGPIWSSLRDGTYSPFCLIYKKHPLL